MSTHLDGRVHALVGDLDTLLETVQNPLAILQLLALGLLVDRGPEQVGAGHHSATLVRLLQQLGSRQGALGSQGIVVLLGETSLKQEKVNDEVIENTEVPDHLLECTDDECDGRKLSS